MSAARKGRAHPHQRDVHNEIPTLAANTMPSTEYSNKLQETLKRQLSNVTMKNHRRRINRILKCWKKEHDDYYCIGQYTIGTDNKIDPSKCFYNHFTNTMNCARLSIKFTLSFLLRNKKKSNKNQHPSMTHVNTKM